MEIFVVGNAAVDEFYAVEDLPSPGESVHAGAPMRDIGGKGANQSVVLSRCGVGVCFVSAIGRDANGRFVEEALAGESLTTTHVARRDVATDISIILVDAKGENIVVTTDEAARSITEADIELALQSASADDVLLLQGNLPIELSMFAFQTGRSRGMRTAFNPSPIRPGVAALWPLVDILVLNAPEASALTGKEGIEAARRLASFDIADVVLTMGGDGAALVSDCCSVIVPATPADVVDTVGAGDTFLAVLLAGLDGERRVTPEAIGRAGRAAAITISRRGVRSAFPTREELASLFA